MEYFLLHRNLIYSRQYKNNSFSKKVNNLILRSKNIQTERIMLDKKSSSVKFLELVMNELFSMEYTL